MALSCRPCRSGLICHQARMLDGSVKLTITRSSRRHTGGAFDLAVLAVHDDAAHVSAGAVAMASCVGV